MKDLGIALQEVLGQKLSAEGYEVDCVPIPVRGDRMVRLRTLEEALDDFETDEITQSYVIQVRRPKTKAQPLMASEPAGGFHRFDPLSGEKPKMDGIYTASGQLNAPYLLQNAQLLYSTGEYALAKNIYKTLLQSSEHRAAALYWIGRCSEAEGKYAEAEGQYEESIAYHATLETYQHYAALLVRNKKDQQAAEVIGRALHLRDLPKDAVFELHKACGNCWMRAENLEKAEKHYRKALDTNPMADEIQANLGALNLQRGDIASAIRHFGDALAANPKNDKAHSGLGSCHLAMGDKRKAHDCFARALGIQLNNPTAIFHLVKCAYEIKSYAVAARIVGEYIEIAPINANLLYSLAGLQYHLGRRSEAKATAQRTLELQPQHAAAAELLKLIESTARNA